MLTSSNIFQGEIILDRLILMSPKVENEREAEEFIKEFVENNSHINGSAGLSRYVGNYTGWLKKLKDDLNINENNQDKIPATTLFAIRKDDQKIIGTISIRHKLNDILIIKGGHIGYSVRPSERRKGYATEILYLGLIKLGKMGVKDALITCYKDNIGSAKAIQKNCGILENELLYEEEEAGKIIQRYWINVDSIK